MASAPGSLGSCPCLRLISQPWEMSTTSSWRSRGRALWGDENCGPGDTRSDADSELDRDKQHYVVLRDMRLDESSTDVDFFHRSIDSKESNVIDSHAWSSSDVESPCHTNIFLDSDSKLNDSSSWGRNFLELPELHSFQKDASLEESTLQGTQNDLVGSFLGEDQGAIHLENAEEDPDVMQLLNSKKLTDNFLFLRDNSLLKEDLFSSGSNEDLDQKVLEADLSWIPESNVKITSMEVGEILPDEGHMVENQVKFTEEPVSPEEFRNSLIPQLKDTLQPSEKGDTLVPSSTLVAGESCSGQLQLINSSSNEECVKLHSSESGIDFTFDSTSESADIDLNPVNSHQSPLPSESANKDILCTVAKNPSLVESFGASQGEVLSLEITDSLEHSLVLPPAQVCKDTLGCDLVVGHTSDISVENILEGNSSPMMPPEMTEAKCSLDETLMGREKDNVSQDMSSDVISAPCLDQISQDSLLDDSVSTSLLTTEHLAETPDSLDSLDMHGLVSPVEVLSTGSFQKLQPPYKTADSGYETENLESPEWNSQSVVKDASPEDCESGVTEDQVMMVSAPPEIVVSEVESVLESVREEATASHQRAPTPPAVELSSGASQNYRDSAYFSDNESEPDKKLEDLNGGTSGEAVPQPSISSDTDFSSDIREASIPNGAVEDEVHKEPNEAQADSPSPTENLQDISPPLFRGSSLPELVLTTEEDWDKEVPVSIDEIKDSDFSEDIPGSQDGLAESTAVSDPPAGATSTPDQETPEKAAVEITVHEKLARSPAGEGPKLKEPDVEGKYLGKLDSRAGGLEDGTEADEEDENSDDSDDDTRAYRVHSSSSESEDDIVHPVPVIITDNDDASNLKSLLKDGNLRTSDCSPQGGDNTELQRKAVSFFDDVTVYLFDQETPTKDLGDHSSNANSNVSEFSSPAPSSSYLNRFTNSESSTDEEGGGFEWDDDFTSPDPSFITKSAGHLIASKTPSVASHYFSPPPPSRTLEPSWNSTSNYSRFSISPASIASFSLTHLTDSDMEQGGNSEDGEKD
ncbi:hypothetical protein COCON_G00028170 [Conger conger]|uniref:Uncharacterized protein n=1 Tax=Conger conger TaxID=82655 RepID=A0A9Q1DY95_CONCO|nr:hypothetical protein COCON_G00028170 [Conger conger]